MIVSKESALRKIRELAAELAKTTDSSVTVEHVASHLPQEWPHNLIEEGCAQVGLVYNTRHGD